ncbi:MAG: alpha/beta hydrolase [Acidimicrobiia bacterium]|nr:alpha/beta hydrolase [Acidimicrobiia bacterium]
MALSTTVWGEGPRRALLLHGLTSAGSTWWRVAEGLNELGFTAVAPDLRAHGTSPAGDDLSIESYRDDVLLLGGGWDLLVGHSLGGAVAAAAATAQPGFAGRIVLEDPAIDSDRTARFLAEGPEPLAHPTVEAIAAENPHWHPHDVELKVEALLQCGPEVSDRTMADASPWDVWPAILNSVIPLLLLGADPSLGTLVSPTKGAEAESENDMIDFVSLEGAGHSMHRDAYDRFFALVRGFVER